MISAEGASVANQRDITITLKDPTAKRSKRATTFEIVLFSSAAMTDLVATGGTTGVTASASGKLLAIVAKKLLRAITTTAGVAKSSTPIPAQTYGYLAVRLLGRRVVAGGVITNA